MSPLAARNTPALALWLVVGLVITGLYVFANLSQPRSLGLGWSLRPGGVILVGMIILTLFETSNVRISALLAVVVCLLAAIFVEYSPLVRSIQSFFGIALTIVADAILFANTTKIRLASVLFLLVSSYVRAVCVYNLFQGSQMMHFFKPGWTL